MSLQNFIKTIWAANIEESMRKTLVAASVANTQYQGELKNLGDQVRILQTSDPSITSYTRDTTIAAEHIDDAVTELIADQAYYFAFRTHDVDAVQSKPELLRQQTDKAAYGFADKVDTHLLNLFAQAGAKSYSTGTTPWEVTTVNVDDVLAAVKEQAKTLNWLEQGRFMIIPPWFETKLLLAGLTIISDNVELFRNGLIGRAFGWDLYVSNNVAITTPLTGAGTKIICGLKNETFAFAGIVNNVEAYRVETGFSDAVKGLYVFGGKIIRPDKAITIYCNKASG